MTEIPDWIEQKIEFDSSNDVQDKHLVKVFIESNEPYLSRKKVALEVGMSKQGVGERLEDLVDLEILDADSVAGGRIYWILDDRSDWPIPPDVEVEPVQREMTVKAFLGQLHVKYGVLAVALTMVGALLMIAFTLIVSYEVSLPVLTSSDVLLGGLLFTIIGYVLLLLAVGLGVWNRYT